MKEISIIKQENRRSIPLDEYFDEMDLTEEEKKERKEFAERMNEIMLFIFSLFILMKQSDYFDTEYITEQLKIRYSDLINEKIELDEYLERYVEEFSKNTIDTTISHEDEEYFLSDDRSILISENEAVTIYSHNDFSNAIKSGKTKKKWITEKDNKVRKNHREINGKTIPIQEPFLVGDSLMLYPKDTETYGASAEEVVNCRCTVKYY